MSDTTGDKNQDVMETEEEQAVAGAGSPKKAEADLTVDESESPDKKKLKEAVADTEEDGAVTPSPEPPVRREIVGLDEIPTWPEYYAALPKRIEFNPVINSKVCVFTGDITRLEIDAIVNAANKQLFPGGGVCGAIHAAAGNELAKECRSIGGCKEGDAVITEGFDLPAAHVIHTVGPLKEKHQILKSCYARCFELMLENKLRSIAFPCIGTGIYGFPNDRAAEIALAVTRNFLEEHHDKVDRIIFCLFLPKDIAIYNGLMPSFFPLI